MTSESLGRGECPQCEKKGESGNLGTSKKDTRSTDSVDEELIA